MDAEQSWEEEEEGGCSITSLSLSFREEKSPLEPHGMSGSGGGTATAQTLQKIPFFTDRNAAVFPFSFPTARASPWLWASSD